jgi:hypothetical protein
MPAASGSWSRRQEDALVSEQHPAAKQGSGQEDSDAQWNPPIDVDEDRRSLLKRAQHHGSAIDSLRMPARLTRETSRDQCGRNTRGKDDHQSGDEQETTPHAAERYCTSLVGCRNLEGAG